MELSDEVLELLLDGLQVDLPIILGLLVVAEVVAEEESRIIETVHFSQNTQNKTLARTKTSNATYFGGKMKGRKL